MGRLRRLWAFVKDPNHSGAVMAVFTVVIAVTGVVYTVFSAKQWFTLSQQLTEMQNTNRPYVFTHPQFSFTQMPTPDEIREIPVTVFINNVGVSPALSVINSEPLVGLDTDEGIVEHGRNCSLNYPETQGLVLPPGQPLVNGSGITTHTITRTLSEDERKDVVVNKTRRLIVLGAVKYSGVRGGNYETIYCYAWNPDSLKGHTFVWSDCPCNKIK